MTRPESGKDDDQNDELENFTDEEAEQLLGGLVGEDGDGDGGKDDHERKSDTDERDWKSETEKWKALARKHEKAANERGAKLKEIEDKDKTEAQRLQEAAESHRGRADKAEAALKRREIAESLAPDHATVRQIAQVAKRMSGDDDDALETDARELFELIAPAPSDEPKSSAKTPSRPKERLRGGSDPEEEDDLPDDPRKLAALLPRSR